MQFWIWMSCGLSKKHLVCKFKMRYYVNLYNKVAVAGASCNHLKCKLCTRTVVAAEIFLVAELRVRQIKIGGKSCFATSWQYTTALGQLFCVTDVNLKTWNLAILLKYSTNVNSQLMSKMAKDCVSENHVCGNHYVFLNKFWLYLHCEEGEHLMKWS